MIHGQTSKKYANLCFFHHPCPTLIVICTIFQKCFVEFDGRAIYILWSEIGHKIYPKFIKAQKNSNRKSHFLFELLWLSGVQQDFSKNSKVFLHFLSTLHAFCKFFFGKFAYFFAYSLSLIDMYGIQRSIQESYILY